MHPNVHCTLFTIAKTWKQFVATWIDLEIIILGKVSQTEKDKYHMISCLYVESKKSDTNEFIYKTETDSQT